MDRATDRRVRSEVGISHRRAIALLVIESDGPMSQRELADLLGHTEPAVSAMMRELVQRGAVSLEAADGRERRVSITEEGSRIVAAVRAMTMPMFDAVMFSAGVDAHVLGDQLQRLAAGLGVDT